MGKIIDGKLYEKGGDGLYHEIPLGLDAARDAKGKQRHSYAVDETTGRPHVFVNRLDAFAKGRMENGGMVYTAMPKDGGEPHKFVNLDRDIAFRVGDSLEMLGATGYLDVTDLEAPKGISGPDFDAGYDVTGREIACPGAKTMVLRFEKGKENNILGGTSTPLHDVDVPVAMLFNENSSGGEVMPLKDAQVQYISKKDNAVAVYDYQAGENVFAAMADLTDPETGLPAAEMAAPKPSLEMGSTADRTAASKPGDAAARFLASLNKSDVEAADNSRNAELDVPGE